MPLSVGEVLVVFVRHSCRAGQRLQVLANVDGEREALGREVQA